MVYPITSLSNRIERSQTWRTKIWKGLPRLVWYNIVWKKQRKKETEEEQEEKSSKYGSAQLRHCGGRGTGNETQASREGSDSHGRSLEEYRVQPVERDGSIEAERMAAGASGHCIHSYSRSSYWTWPLVGCSISLQWTLERRALSSLATMPAVSATLVELLPLRAAVNTVLQSIQCCLGQFTGRSMMSPIVEISHHCLHPSKYCQFE